MKRMGKVLTGAVLMLGVLGLLASCSYFQKPRDVLKLFVKSMKAKDWNAMWGFLSTKSQKDFEDNSFTPMKKQIEKLSPEERQKVNPKIGMSAEQVSKMDAKQFFALFMEKSGVGEFMAKKLDPEKLNIESETINKDKAAIKIKDMTNEINFIREKGIWKIELKS